MNDPEGNQSTSSGRNGWIGVVIFLVLFGLPFAGFGLCALAAGIRKLADGAIGDGLIPFFMGLVFSGIGFLLMFAGIWAQRKVRRDAAIKARFPDKPWMVRQDWADGKIKAVYSAPIWFFLLWSFVALACSAPAFGQISREWQKGNPAILVALIFPVVACILLACSFRQWQARRRLGVCFFELAQTPAPIGGILEGMIQTAKPIKLEHDLYLKCSCVRRQRAGKETFENTLWQEEKIYMAGADLPQPEPGRGAIPVHFKLPADQPETYTEGDDIVFWRLDAKTKMRGSGFHVAFDLPVFKVASSALADADEPAADPTAALQAPIEDIRRDEHSRIRVSDGPNGREFYFPAARNVVACIFVTFMAASLDALPVLLHRSHAPLIFPIVFGIFGVILTCLAFSAWFKSSRITVDSTGVQATNQWLFLRRSRRFNTGDIERFDTASGGSAGTQTYWDIKLIPRGQSLFEKNKARYQETGQMSPTLLRSAAIGGTTLAGNLANKTEADWLVSEMTRALGRPVGSRQS